MLVRNTSKSLAHTRQNTRKLIIIYLSHQSQEIGEMTVNVGPKTVELSVTRLVNFRVVLPVGGVGKLMTTANVLSVSTTEI